MKLTGCPPYTLHHYFARVLATLIITLAIVSSVATHFPKRSLSVTLKTCSRPKIQFLRLHSFRSLSSPFHSLRGGSSDTPYNPFDHENSDDRDYRQANTDSIHGHDNPDRSDHKKSNQRKLKTFSSKIWPGEKAPTITQPDSGDPWEEEILRAQTFFRKYSRYFEDEKDMETMESENVEAVNTAGIEVARAVAEEEYVHLEDKAGQEMEENYFGEDDFEGDFGSGFKEEHEYEGYEHGVNRMDAGHSLLSEAEILSEMDKKELEIEVDIETEMGLKCEIPGDHAAHDAHDNHGIREEPNTALGVIFPNTGQQESGLDVEDTSSDDVMPGFQEGQNIDEQVVMNSSVENEADVDAEFGSDHEKNAKINEFDEMGDGDPSATTTTQEAWDQNIDERKDFTPTTSTKTIAVDGASETSIATEPSTIDTLIETDKAETKTSDTEASTKSFELVSEHLPKVKDSSIALFSLKESITEEEHTESSHTEIVAAAASPSVSSSIIDDEVDKITALAASNKLVEAGLQNLLRNHGDAPSIPYVITSAMKRVLMEELGYTSEEVRVMRPDVAVVIVNEGLRRPTGKEGMGWDLPERFCREEEDRDHLEVQGISSGNGMKGRTERVFGGFSTWSNRHGLHRLRGFRSFHNRITSAISTISSVPTTLGQGMRHPFDFLESYVPGISTLAKNPIKSLVATTAFAVLLTLFGNKYQIIVDPIMDDASYRILREKHCSKRSKSKQSNHPVLTRPKTSSNHQNEPDEEGSSSNEISRATNNVDLKSKSLSTSISPSSSLSSSKNPEDIPSAPSLSRSDLDRTWLEKLISYVSTSLGT